MRDSMILIVTLTLLTGVKAVSVDVIQHHVEGLWDSVRELHFEKRQILEWHSSCPKQLHKTDDMLNITCTYTAVIPYTAYLMTLQITQNIQHQMAG
jgi:hypothetical protein